MIGPQAIHDHMMVPAVSLSSVDNQTCWVAVLQVWNVSRICQQVIHIS